MSDAPTDDRPPDGEDTADRPGLLASAFGRPRLFVPFVLLGMLALAVDALWRADPVPTVIETFPERGLYFHLAVLPELWTTVGRTPGAVLGLRPVYLLYVGATLGLAVTATGVATGYVVAWYLDRGSPRRDRLVRLAGYAVAFSALTTLLTAVAAFGFLVGLLVLVLDLYLVVRLFTVPGYLLDGASVREAVVRSAATTRGHGLSIAVFVVLVGVAGYLLVSVPTVGPLLATALAGTVHAVAVARCYRRVATPAERGTLGDAPAAAD